MPLSTQPQSFFLPSIQALLAWTPATQAYSNFNISTVPLIPRPLTVARALVQDGNDFKGGYVPNADLYPQGSNDADTYNFSFWQYLDSFYYFSHHRISVPTTWWTNAAHLNGVSVLGTIIFENGSASEFTLMLNNQAAVIAQLVKLAQQYGFDGWFINIEINLPNGITYPTVTAFESALRTAMQQANPRSLVIWYDSVTTDGIVDYQNCLNSKNNPFFVACNGIFPNYWWDQAGAKIRGSVQQAQADQRSPFDVYTGVDVWARGTYYSAGYGNPPKDSVSAVGVCVANGTSVGLFAPGWTFEQAQGSGEAHHQDYEARDKRFWIGQGYGSGSPASTDCIAQSVPARPVPAGLPFVTNFDRGRGLSMAVRGATVSSQQWSNLSLQGLQPTYQFQRVAGNSAVFAPSINQSVAYDGGACLRIVGNSAVSQTDSVTYRLFDFTAPVIAPLQIEAVFQPVAASAPYPAVQVALIFSDGSSYLTPATSTAQGAWQVLAVTMNENQGKTITQLQLVIGPSVGGTPGPNYGVNVGQLRVKAASSAPRAVQNLVAQPIYASDTSLGALLTWNYPAGTARYFDIWQVNGSQFQWLLRVCANTAWIGNLVPLSGSGTFTFAVQPVDYSLTPQPQSACATAAVTFNPLQFNDGPTIALLGNPPITALNIQAGDILNAVQATNGAYALPQHGDTSGRPYAVTLDAGDTLVEVSGRTGVWYGWNCVVQIQFKTRKGKTYGPYGSMAGVTSSTPFTYTAGASQSVLAFAGSLVNVPLAGSSTRVNIIQSLQVTLG